MGTIQVKICSSAILQLSRKTKQKLFQTHRFLKTTTKLSTLPIEGPFEVEKSKSTPQSFSSEIHSLGFSNAQGHVLSLRYPDLIGCR